MSVRRSVDRLVDPSVGRSVPFWGSGLCFHTGIFSSFFSSSSYVRPSQLKSKPQGPNPSLEAQIPVSRPKSQPWGSFPSSRLKSHPQGPNPTHEAQIPASKRDLSIEDGIWASRVGLRPWDWDWGHNTRIWALRLGFEWGDVRRRKMRRRRRRKFSCVKA